MNISEILEDAKQAIGSKGVYGTPYEKNGVTIIPAAKVMGGAGGGEGQMPVTGEDGTAAAAQPTSSGGGFGVSGQPTGAFVIKGETVTWVPAVDVNRLMLGFQVVMIVFFLAVRAIAKARPVATKAGA